MNNLNGEYRIRNPKSLKTPEGEIAEEQKIYIYIVYTSGYSNITKLF